MDKDAYTHRGLGCKYEWDRTPTKGIEHDEQIDGDDCENTVSVQRSTLDDRVYRLVDANVEHGKGLSKSADDQAPFPAEPGEGSSISMILASQTTGQL